MAMVTQCPHCRTVFNVTPEQLFARDGSVRCGQCRRVFDGLVNLTSVEALQAGVPPPLAEASDAELRAKVSAMEAEHAEVSSGFSPINWPMVPDVPVVPMPPQAELAMEAGEAEATQGAADASSAADSPFAAAETADAEPNPFAAKETQRYLSRRRSRVWTLAAVAAALSLGAQALHTFRNDIAARVPGLRPMLAQLCAWSRCAIYPPQRPSALNIQASDLLILDKTKPHLVQLIVTMQNQSSTEVGYPAIDLALNDRFNHAVARRVFLPREYLRNFDLQKSVIAASGTSTVRIDLDVSGLSAGGFELLLIPAPQS